MNDTTKSKKEKKEISINTILNWIATIFWILGFALAFVIPAKSKYIYIPDSLLLIGFWPLLWQWRFSLPWIFFGVMNMLIGFVLQVSVFLPNANFPKEMLLAKEHLANQHSPIAWIIIGAISAIFGALRLIKNIVLMIKRRIDNNKESKTLKKDTSQ